MFLSFPQVAVSAKGMGFTQKIEDLLFGVAMDIDPIVGSIKGLSKGLVIKADVAGDGTIGDLAVVQRDAGVGEDAAEVITLGRDGRVLV